MAMTQAEIKLLLEQARREAKAATMMVKQRSAALKAELEAKLSATYEADLECWADITEDLQRQVQEANARIAALCTEMGVPARFGPRFTLGWWDRGENASKERRDELRRAGEAKIAALEQAALAALEAHSVQMQREIVAGGLTSAEAKRLLQGMPLAEQLMPGVSLEELKQALERQQPEQTSQLLRPPVY